MTSTTSIDHDRPSSSAAATEADTSSSTIGGNTSLNQNTTLSSATGALDDFTILLTPDDARVLVELLKLAVARRVTQHKQDSGAVGGVGGGAGDGAGGNVGEAIPATITQDGKEAIANVLTALAKTYPQVV